MNPGRSRKKRGSPNPRVRSRSSGSRPFVIDFHAHMIVPEVVAFAREHLVKTGAPQDRRLTKKDMLHAKKWAEGARRRMGDFKLRIKDMDNLGVDIQVLTPSLVHQCTYWADP